MRVCGFAEDTISRRRILRLYSFENTIGPALTKYLKAHSEIPQGKKSPLKYKGNGKYQRSTVIVHKALLTTRNTVNYGWELRSCILFCHQHKTGIAFCVETSVFLSLLGKCTKNRFVSQISLDLTRE